MAEKWGRWWGMRSLVRWNRRGRSLFLESANWTSFRNAALIIRPRIKHSNAIPFRLFSNGRFEEQSASDFPVLIYVIKTRGNIRDTGIWACKKPGRRRIRSLLRSGLCKLALMKELFQIFSQRFKADRPWRVFSLNPLISNDTLNANYSRFLIAHSRCGYFLMPDTWYGSIRYR